MRLVFSPSDALLAELTRGRVYLATENGSCQKMCGPESKTSNSLPVMSLPNAGIT